MAQFAQASPLEPSCDTFYFLRHGQTDGNIGLIFQSGEQPLNARGLQQAETAAALLADVPLASIVSSSMPRALVTARAAGKRHGIEPSLSDQLRERHFGVWIGTPSSVVDWSAHPEGGESPEQFVDRTRAGFVSALKHKAPVLVVAHGGTLHVLVALLSLTSDLSVFSNAQPLRFDRAADGSWAVHSLQSNPDTSAGIS